MWIQISVRFPVLLMMLAVLISSEPKVFGSNESVKFSGKVNLALRRTAHHLLTENGDSASVIPPVQQEDANTFTVKVDHLFDYDKLPLLLQESLDVHGIKRSYDVSVLDCTSGEIRLGYNFLDLNRKGGVPCVGRRQERGCYNLMVRFDPEMQKASAGGNWWILPVGSLLVGLGFIVWKRGKKQGDPLVTEKVEAADDIRGAKFGDSEFDLQHMLLNSGKATYNLTYREAKLLNLFVSSPNQILERDFILKSVWEDEGIIVGRSVDVFVSRLRKMLAGDPRLRIAAVHGVGYRMDITP